MPSFSQILSAHAPMLFLDAASSRIQVGWFENHLAEPQWGESRSEAGIGIFECVEKLGIDPTRARAFVFCEGPGSILGVRICAIAIRTWNVRNRRPVFTCQSLELIAHALARTDVTVIADARRETWHTFAVGSELRRRATASLVGELVMPEGFRNWTPLPQSVALVPYTVSEYVQSTKDRDIFRNTEQPDAFLHEEPSYVKWSPQIHRAP